MNSVEVVRHDVKGCNGDYGTMTSTGGCCKPDFMPSLNGAVGTEEKDTDCDACSNEAKIKKVCESLPMKNASVKFWSCLDAMAEDENDNNKETVIM